MDVREHIRAKALIKLVDFRQDREDTIFRNMLLNNRKRMLEAETVVKKYEQKYAREYAVEKKNEHFVCPRFVKRPVDTNILAQTRGTIEARVSGIPKPEVKWYQNGLPITDRMYPKMKIRHYEPNIYILEICNALMTDMGTYTCIAQNCYGSITSAVTVRIVHGRSKIEEYPQIVQRLHSIDVDAGKSGRLEASVTGVPKPEVKWYRNWIPLKEDDRIKIRHYDPDTYVLFINNAKPEDAGLYTCKARNDVGTRSTSAMVYVEGNKNLLVYKPMPRQPHDFISDNEWSEELNQICHQLERRANNLSQIGMSDLMHRRTIAKESNISYLRTLYPM